MDAPRLRRQALSLRPTAAMDFWQYFVDHCIFLDGLAKPVRDT